MKTKNLLKALTAFLLGLSLLTGCAGKSGDSKMVSGKDGKELKTLRLAVMTGSLEQYYSLVGIEQGIFERYGINLVTTEYAFGINTIDAIVNGNADIGDMADFAAVNRLGVTQHNTNLVAFSELTGGGAKSGGLYVAPEFKDDLSKLDGSKGFVTQVGTVNEYLNSQAIEYLGFDESKQNIINTDTAQAARALAQTNSASATIANGSNAKYLEEDGWVLAVTAQELKQDIGSYSFTTKEFLNDNTELIANFLKAVDESYKYVDANFDECGKYLENKLGIKQEDFELQWKQQGFKTGFSEEAAQHLESIQKWAVEHKKYDESYDIRKFIDVSAAKLAFPENVTVDLSSVN